MKHSYIIVALLALCLGYGNLRAADDLSFKQLSPEGTDTDALKVLSGLGISLPDPDEDDMSKKDNTAVLQSGSVAVGPENAATMTSAAQGGSGISSMSSGSTAQSSVQVQVVVSKSVESNASTAGPKAVDLVDYIGAVSAPLSWGGSAAANSNSTTASAQIPQNSKFPVALSNTNNTVVDPVSLVGSVIGTNTVDQGFGLTPTAAQPSAVRVPISANVVGPAQTQGVNNANKSTVGSAAISATITARSGPAVTTKTGIGSGIQDGDLDIIQLYSDSTGDVELESDDNVQGIMEIGPSLGFVDWKNNIKAKSKKKKKPPEPVFEELSPLVYKKTYDDANRHLASLLYEGDFQLMIFEAIAQNDSLALSHLIDMVGTADIKLAATGDTPLIYAVKLGNIDAVSTLIAKGAHIDMKNNSGINALQMAKKLGKRDLIQVINSMIIEG